MAAPVLRGRLTLSPTGFLHLGHTRTFWTAKQRAKASHGVLVLRNEDLDSARSRPAYAAAMLEDLRWFGEKICSSRRPANSCSTAPLA